ncbi:gamma-glutamyltransferase family protein [soil metagenome]
MNFDWPNPYPRSRTALFARNVVSTSQPLAAQAGLRIMALGGNAVDAAIAAAAVIMQTEPVSNGLGSDNFALVWDPKEGKLLGLNASGVAPAAWDHGYFKSRYGSDLVKDRPVRGWDTVTVPGAVAGWVTLHRRLGRLPFAELFGPAIEYADRGFAISPNVQEKWALAVPLLREQPGFAEHFMPKGRAPEVGEHFKLAGAARTLRRIAESGGADFYQGEVADAIAAHAAAHGGALKKSDLSSFFDNIGSEAGAHWVDPISMPYRAADGKQYELNEIPPNGQGIAALIALGIIDRSPRFAEAVAAEGIDCAEAQHILIEAMKLGFADTYAHVADRRSMAIDAAVLLDGDYLTSQARRIDTGRAQTFTTGLPPKGGTIYLSAADESGMMISLIQSNYMGFGSGVVVPGYGVSLQNRGHGFSLDPAHPNLVTPGRRPFHTIIPAFLTEGGQPRMSFGVMGGNMQPQGHLQTLVRMLTARQQPQAACDAPRWKWMQGASIEIESTMKPDVANGLAQRGHEMTSGNDSYMDFGAGQFIWSLGDPKVDGYVVASDPRRDGQAVGY